MQALTEEYPLCIEVPIAWGDMDALQHVNNKVYFKHFESARMAYFEKIGFYEVMERTGIGPILAATKCVFKIPLTYPDQVTVGARVELTEIDKDRFNMRYAVISHQFESIAAVGEGLIVTYDYQQQQKAPIPEEIRERIHALEKRV